MPVLGWVPHQLLRWAGEYKVPDFIYKPAPFSDRGNRCKIFLKTSNYLKKNGVSIQGFRRGGVSRRVGGNDTIGACFTTFDTYSPLVLGVLW